MAEPSSTVITFMGEDMSGSTNLLVENGLTQNSIDLQPTSSTLIPFMDDGVPGSTTLLAESGLTQGHFDFDSQQCVKVDPEAYQGDTKFPLVSEEGSQSPVSSSSSSSSSSLSSSQEEKATCLRYPPCEVCSRKASGLHYGCYTCEACKNFFRRYLMRNEVFQCKRGGNCEIVNKTRGNCSGCRLRKCLELGMSKEKSKIGRYTHAQRTETINEVKKLEGKLEVDSSWTHSISEVDSAIKAELEQIIYNTDVPVKQAVKPKNEELCMTQSDFDLVETLRTAMDAIEHFGELGKTDEGIRKIIEDHYQKYLAKVQLFGPLKAIPKEEYFTLLKMYNIDLGERWDHFKREANNCSHIVKRYCDFACQIPGFKELNGKDQESLLKFGHCEFFLVLLSNGYMEEYQIFLEMNGVPSHVEEAADKIFSRTLVELQCELSLRWQKLKLSKEEMAVLIAMSLVCSDRCDLEDIKPVEKVHSRLADLMCKLLYHLHGKEWHKRFAKIVDCLTASRHGSELYFKEYQEMSQNELVTEAAPNFPVLCPDT